jgi:hypothetical protein
MAPKKVLRSKKVLRCLPPAVLRRWVRAQVRARALAEATAAPGEDLGNAGDDDDPGEDLGNEGDDDDPGEDLGNVGDDYDPGEALGNDPGEALGNDPGEASGSLPPDTGATSSTSTCSCPCQLPEEGSMCESKMVSTRVGDGPLIVTTFRRCGCTGCGPVGNGCQNLVESARMLQQGGLCGCCAPKPKALPAPPPAPLKPEAPPAPPPPPSRSRSRSRSIGRM